MQDRLRVGIIGTGTISRIAHLPNYVGSDNYDLVAVYDTDIGAAERAREQHKTLFSDQAASEGAACDGEPLKVCGSWEELMDQVDVVDICTSLDFHAFYSAMALERDVHVMTEKPMARSWWEAHHVAGLARKSRALFQLNDDNLFIPRYLRMKNLIESGMIGEVQTIWMTRGGPSSERPLWFWNGAQSGGGAIFDYGSHAVASSWFLAGYRMIPVEVKSLGIVVKERTRLVGGRMQEIDVDDDAHFKIRFVNPDSGDWITAIIEATWAQPELGRDGSDVHGYVEIEGTTGSIRAHVNSEGEDILRVTNRVFGTRDFPIQSIRSEEESFRGEFDNFAECIREARSSVLNAEIGEGIIRILNTAQLSELKGRISVAPAELEKFSEELAAGASSPWDAGERIAKALTESYRTA